jgi:hypothetical protein
MSPEVSMTRSGVSWLLSVAAIPLVSAAVVFAQESPVSLPSGTRPPDGAANSVMESMHIPSTTGAPFSATSVALLTQLRQGSTVRFGFISQVARDSSGRLYFENRRTIGPSGEPLARAYFIVVDPEARTRTVCYVTTKTCRIDAFHHESYDVSEGGEEAPPARATDSVSLGKRVIESEVVEGTRETTVIAAGAYGNRDSIVRTEEVWHSPDLDLDLLITRTDPRWGTQTRKMTEISRADPDPAFFTIPADYKMLDNRPPSKQ